MPSEKFISRGPCVFTWCKPSRSQCCNTELILTFTLAWTLEKGERRRTVRAARMSGDADSQGESARPEHTWGSTVHIPSGVSSAASPTQSITEHHPRILAMRASPDGQSPGDRHANRPREFEKADADRSSPVEQFSTPARPSPTSHPTQHSDLGSYPSEQAGEGSGNYTLSMNAGQAEYTEAVHPAQIRGWEPFPDTRGREAIHDDIDPNGDDDVVANQVRQLVASDREAKRKRMQAEQSISSQPSTAGHDVAPLQTPKTSTPPPPPKRQKRLPKSPPRTAAPTLTPDIERVKGDDLRCDNLLPSELISPENILGDPFSESSCQAIARYCQASPMIPDFLKAEVQRCVHKVCDSFQRQSAQSDSDTQEDGYLRTKAFWALELLRVGSNGIVAGDKLTSAVADDENTLVLSILNNGTDYALQLVGPQEMLMSRSEARSNPWFDRNGYPFSIVFRYSLSGNGSSHGTASSVITQGSAEQNILSQGEQKALQERVRIAVEEKEEAERRWKMAQVSVQSSQEHNDILQEQYNEASQKAVQWAKEAEQLNAQVTSLSASLTDGMKVIQDASRARIERLASQLKVTQSQLELLKQQNRLTDDTVREKAAKWDAYQAKEQARLRDLEKRRADVGAERAALYQSMQDEESLRAAYDQLPPHERFLRVDLANQKEILDGESEGELAMLRKEAEEAMDSAVDINAPRSRRRAAAGDGSAGANVVQAFEHSQEQAQAAAADAADALEGELLYHQTHNSTLPAEPEVPAPPRLGI